MSLTGLLDDRQSPLRRFFDEELPNVGPVQRRWTAAWPATVLPSAGTPLGLVGMAFDYRLRYHLVAMSPAETAAAAGAGNLTLTGKAAGPGMPRCWTQFVEALEGLVADLDPPGRRLGDEDERTLARYCCVLALFETCYRTRRSSPLHALNGDATIQELFAIVEDGAVEDVVALSRALQGGGRELLCGQSVTANPRFAGSRSVGRADADVIVDGCLVEVKVTTQSRCRREVVYQLVGYPLLNWDRRHRIDSAGFYLARIPRLLTWPLDELLTILAGRPVELSELQDKLRMALVRSNPGQRSEALGSGA